MLTIEEIENISFRRAGIGGYKVEDVDTFVDGVIEKVKQLVRANKEMEARIEQLNKQVIQYETQAESVQSAIITAEAAAKKLVQDAAAKAENILSTAQAQAKETTESADKKAAVRLAESELRAQTVLNSALARSAAGIDENNRVITQQKQYMTQLQSEVTRFREALIESYKNHLQLINALPKAEEFRQYQEKMQEQYPTVPPVTPQAVAQEVRKDVEQAVADAQKDTREIQVEMVDADKVRAISEEIRTNLRAKEALEREQLEATQEIPRLIFDETADSNLDDIQAAMSAAGSDASEEPKPTSIDEIGNGLIFGAEETEEAPQEKQDKQENKRRPITFTDTSSDDNQ